MLLSAIAACKSDSAANQPKLLDGEDASAGKDGKSQAADGGVQASGDSADTPSLGEEAERLRKMQLIRVIENTPEGNGQVMEMSAEDLGLAFVGECRGLNTVAPEIQIGQPVAELLSQSCGTVYEETRCLVEAAGKMLEVASSAHIPIPSLSEGWTVTPQPAGPRHRSALVAARLIDKATRISLMMLDGVVIPEHWVSGSGDCLAETCTCENELEKNVRIVPRDGVTQPIDENLGTRFVTIAVEGYHLLKESVENAGEIGLAVADAQRSDTGSIYEGMRRQMTAAELSRSALAHQLIGGDPGLAGLFATPDATPDALCSIPQLSPSGLRALSLLREAALSPEDILGSLPTEVLVEDPYKITRVGTPATQCGSLRERLREQWQDSRLDDLTVKVPKLFGLSLADFNEARDYLTREFRTFARSKYARLTEGTCWGEGFNPDGRYPKFAATAAEPGPIDPIYWSTVARFAPIPHFSAIEGAELPFLLNDDPPEVWAEDPAELPIDLYGGLAERLGEYVQRASLTLMDRPAVTDMQEEVGGALNLLLGDALQEQSGRLFVMRWTDAIFQGTTYTELTVPVLWGTSPTEGAIVVRGEEGLRCALYGNIEGSPCNQAELDSLRVGRLDRDYRAEVRAAYIASGASAGIADAYADAAMRSIPSGKASYGTVGFVSVRENEQLRLYIVKPRGGKAPASTGPGEYVAVAGFQYREEGYAETGHVQADLFTSLRDADVYTLMPELDRRAAEFLAPNRKWCSQSQISCAGTSFDERLALETELTDNGDMREDSWRHYLTLARQAADEADELGRSYLQAEVDRLSAEVDDAQREDQIRERRERELEELQNICGTSIATEKIFDVLVPGGDIKAASPPPCTTPAEALTCSNDFYGACFAGVCISNVMNLVNAAQSDPDMYRLLQCMTSAETTAVATAGDQPLCITYAAGNRNRICEVTRPDGTSVKLEATACPALIEPGRTCGVPGSPTDVFQREIGVGDATGIAAPLNYFATDQGQASGVDPVHICNEFRRARVNADIGSGAPPSFSEHVAKTALAGLRSDTYLFENVQRVANDIGWAAYAYNGSMRYLDADTYPVPNGGWPCMGRHPSTAVEESCSETAAGGVNTSFFCQQIDCNNNAQFGEWSRRAFWATVALRAMAYRGTPFQRNGFTGTGEGAKFDSVDPLGGIGILAYGLRLAGDRPEITWWPTNKIEPWRPNHYLLSQYVSTTADDAFDFNHTQLRIYQTADNGAPTSDGDVYAWNPDGSPIRTVAGNGRFLQVRQGTLGSMVTKSQFNRCEQEYTVAPLWWLGLGVSDNLQEAHLPGGGTLAVRASFPAPGEGSADRGQLNFGWLQRYLLHSDRAFEQPAPASALWDTYECGKSGVGSSLLTIERNWQIAGSPSSQPSNIGTMVQQRPTSREQVNQAVLDAVELLCHFNHEYDQPPEIQLKNPPPFRGVDDLDDVAEYFRKVASSLNVAAGKQIFANLPAQAIDSLTLNPINSAYPALGGKLAESVLALRGALIQLSQAAPALAHEVEGLSFDMRELQGHVRKIGLESRVLDIQLMKESVQRVSDCVASSIPTVSTTIGASPSATVTFNPASVVICSNAFAQVVFSAEIKDIEEDKLKEDGDLAINDFARKIAERREVLRRLADQIREASEIVNEHLAIIDGAKSAAKRAVQRAMFMNTELAAKQAELSGAMRARANVERERYERALTNAKRLAFLAKRSIEQRIGMHLSELRENLPLVEAPSTWEARACATTGVDFATFQQLAYAGDPDAPELDAFADQYIGDYVTKLENLIESYPLHFNFHEGDDTVVISLRDDIVNSAAMCDVPTGNFLYHSGNPGQLVAIDRDEVILDPGAQGWTLEGCAHDADGQGLRDCISVTQVSADSPLQGEQGASGQRIEFGEDGTICDYENTSDPDRCGYTETSALRQDVYLEAGTYLLSWYAKDSSAADNLLSARSETGQTLSNASTRVAGTAGSWQRYFNTFFVSVPSAVSVVIQQPASAPPSVMVAATMLEDVSRIAADAPLAPRPYISTSSTLNHSMAACEDAFGKELHSRWDYRCAHLCPNGFGAPCGSESVSTQCYYEITFGLSQREIESGHQLSYSGFARGNFNYRLDTVAVNFVGTGTRDCDDGSASCYTAGFIPYSISHDGPFYVRNHEGEDFEAKLFPGWIEHARGLAAERVITNPISSADRSLLQDYQRSELRGRPLDGIFTLRVWDEPGVRFNAIEDAQIVVNYNYWTRFE